jgi:hypothetical protein
MLMVAKRGHHSRSSGSSAKLATLHPSLLVDPSAASAADVDCTHAIAIQLRVADGPFIVMPATAGAWAGRYALRVFTSQPSTVNPL